MPVTRRTVLGGAIAAAAVSAARPVFGFQPRASLHGRTAGEQREVQAIKLCWCPPGRFIMGSPSAETGHRPDEAQVDVTLSQGFWIAKFETTQGQWSRIAREFPDRKPAAATGEGEAFPVYWVNFHEAERFCKVLTDRARAEGNLTAAWEFRLPTEAQWEYACRAGTATATSFGDRLGRHQANFRGEPVNGGQDGPVLERASGAGSYPENPWGISDMHGNIFEWCRDWYHLRLPGGTDPDLYGVRGVANRDGTYSRVRRGGSWADDGWACRSACRLRYEPDRRSDHIGFRIVLVQT